MNADDYFSIQNLIYRYADCLDRGDLEAVGRLFSRADIYMPGDTEPSISCDAAGFAALLGQWTRIYPETGTPRTRHVTTNLIIEPDGVDQARTQSYFTVLQSTPWMSLQAVAAGTYRDRFAKRDGTWCFTERREEMPLVGNLDSHLLQAFNGP